MKNILSRVISLLIIFLVINIPLSILANEISDSEENQVEQKRAHQVAGEFIVAKVNGVGITMEKLSRQMRKTTMNKYGREKITAALAQRIKKESMEQLITEELAYQRSLPVAGTITQNEIEEKIAETEKFFGGKERFSQHLKRERMTWEDFQKQTERFLVVKKALEKTVYNQVQISDQALEEMYEQSKENFTQQELVQITDIVFFLDPQAPDSFSKGNRILEKLQNELNSDPEKLVTDGTFYVDKDIKVNRDKNPALYQEAKKLEENGLSEVLDIDGTMHIIKLTGFRPKVEKSFQDVLPELKRKLTGEMRKQAVQNWMADLKENADIEIYDFSVD